MGKTLNLMLKNLQSFVDSCYDTIALYLCLHLVMRYQLTCHKRAVPALDKYWDNLTAILWPRFQYVFELNIQSIKECDPVKFNKEIGPHYVSFLNKVFNILFYLSDTVRVALKRWKIVQLVDISFLVFQKPIYQAPNFP